MRVLLTGATGFIGKHLTAMLVARDDQVTVVARNPERARNSLQGCEVIGALPDLSSFDALVNLAGEPLIGKRWNPEQKQRIKLSRVDTTTSIVEALKVASPMPRVLVNASAIGIYGNRGDDLLDEQQPMAQDFIGEVCSAWEAAAQGAQDLGVRTVAIRIGLVLGAGGGAIEKMSLPFKLGLGGPMGSGRQWMSWVHVNDLNRLILHALDQASMQGTYNGTAPHPVTNREFATTLGKVFKRPALLPTPTFALRIALGEVAHLLTDSQRCKSDKVLATDFRYDHPHLESALRAILEK